MAETFYTALGVADDADPEAIREAYREEVKQRHPDVSDDPGAPRDFSRLTTARDVLTDGDERDRYDRLGHATYVERHLETSAWGSAQESGTAGSGGDSSPAESPSSSGGSATGNGSAASPTEGSGQRHRRSGPGQYDRTAWLGEDWDGPQGGKTRRTAASDGGATASAGAGEANADWQHASEAYRYQPSSARAERRSVSGTLGPVLRSVGPWLIVHAILIAAAIGTAWYTFASTAVTQQFTLPAMAFGILLVGLVVMLAALHVVSLLYG